MSGILFEDIFDIKDVDPEGKQFDRGKIFIYTSLNTPKYYTQFDDERTH
jgi:hypothetical protein